MSRASPTVPPTASTDPNSPPVLLEPATPEELAAFRALDLARLPRHVAIIMDGNGRWARSKSLASRVKGHEAGVDAVRSAARTATQLRCRALTLYAFSTENWSRPMLEVEALMALLDRYLVDEVPELMENNIRLTAMGSLDDLRAGTRRRLEETIALTARNTGLVLNLALSYGSRQEITDAVRRIATEARDGRLDPASITAETISAHLYQPALGDPELLIRTSGEVRVSNFMLWQIAYTELVILDTFWPDFRRRHFLEAVGQYQRRERRFGGIGT